MTPEIAPEVVERMMALVRGMVQFRAGLAEGHPVSVWHKEASAIVALLPEPVDGDLSIAEALAKHAEPDFVTPLPSARLERLTGHILAAIKRGRELERGKAGGWVDPAFVDRELASRS